MQDYNLYHYLKIGYFVPITYYVKHFPVDVSDSVLSNFANHMHNNKNLQECLLKNANTD